MVEVVTPLPISVVTSLCFHLVGGGGGGGECAASLLLFLSIMQFLHSLYSLLCYL